jgi:drug/metabolite transporter (DMT)-like permease
VPPLQFVLLRLAGSLALIAPALVATRQPLLPVRDERLTLFGVGELQVSGFLVRSIIGLAIIPAGRAIVLAYTMPLWAIRSGCSYGQSLSAARRLPGRRSGLPVLSCS